MVKLSFTWDADANGYLSDVFTLERSAVVLIALAELAPVVTQKLMDDEEWETFACTPESSDSYRITIAPTHAMTLRLAAPVSVKECVIIIKGEG